MLGGVSGRTYPFPLTRTEVGVFLSHRVGLAADRG